MSFDRCAPDRQYVQDHELGKDFSGRSQSDLRRRKRRQCHKVAHDAMLRIVLAIADRLMPVGMTRWFTGRIGAGCVIVAGVVPVMVAVMTALPAATSMTFGRSAIGTLVMRPVGMAGTAAMAVQRRRDCIGEQITRQHDPDGELPKRDFPQNGHYRSLNRQISTDSHKHTSLCALPLECNRSVFSVELYFASRSHVRGWASN